MENTEFGSSFQDSFFNSFVWVHNYDQTKLASANDLYWLIRKIGGECWMLADFKTNIPAVGKYWNE